MTQRRRSLPEFSCPPLAEVALSVQFDPIQKLTIPEVGLLWQEYSEKFDHVEQQSPIESIVERFGVRSKQLLNPRLELMTSAPIPRVWFLDEHRRELIQIQNDRFIRNWRKVQDDDDYPRYIEHIRPSFVKDLSIFTEFLASRQLGKLTPNQCEVTYVNVIHPSSAWSDHSKIQDAFSLFSGAYNGIENCDIEELRFQIKHLLTDEDNNPIGRLHVEASPAYSSKDNQELIELKIIARGKPASETIDGALEFIDFGREKIVQVFDKITNTSLHNIWEKL